MSQKECCEKCEGDSQGAIGQCFWKSCPCHSEVKEPKEEHEEGCMRYYCGVYQPEKCPHVCTCKPQPPNEERRSCMKKGKEDDCTCEVSGVCSPTLASYRQDLVEKVEKMRADGKWTTDELTLFARILGLINEPSKGI